MSTHTDSTDTASPPIKPTSDTAYHFLSVFTLFTATLMALVSTFGDTIDSGTGVTDTGTAVAITVNGMGLGVLSVIPGVIATMPFITRSSQTQHRVTWAGAGTLSTVAIGLLVLLISPNTQIYILYPAYGLALLGITVAMWISDRLTKEPHKRRVFSLTGRILGAIVIALPAVAIIVPTITTPDASPPTQLIPAGILIITALCLLFSVTIKGFPVGYTLALVVGVMTVLATGFGAENLILATWSLGIVIATFGAMGLTLHTTFPFSPPQPRPTKAAP